MVIRPAQARDLDACLALDDAFETDYVWQMDTNRQEGRIHVGFRETRLPRTMRVPGCTAREVVLEHFERGECFLVAEDETGIHGFLDATAEPWKRQVRIHHLTVTAELRRHGIGSDLVRAALRWAREQNLATVMVAAQTKNFPAIALVQRFGFAFCGFNDRYYASRDIALFFALSLR